MASLLLWAGAAAIARAQDPTSGRPPHEGKSRAAAPTQEQTSGTASCGSKPIPGGRVRTVVDGRTFLLEDGREVRLAAIEVAPLSASIAAAASSPATGPPAAGDSTGQGTDQAGRDGQRALSDLVRGREVVLRQSVEPADRYGRIIAYGFVRGEGRDRLLQSELLEQGQARVAARVEDRACAAMLSEHERKARRAGLGVWVDPDYSLRPADDAAGITARRGRFAVIAGDVVSVREVGGMIYVNFGRRWSESFTAVVLKRNASALAAAGLDPRRLRGRRVEVRGFVEQRGGPRIEIARPEQIAVIPSQ